MGYGTQLSSSSSSNAVFLSTFGATIGLVPIGLVPIVGSGLPTILGALGGDGWKDELLEEESSFSSEELPLVTFLEAGGGEGLGREGETESDFLEARYDSRSSSAGWEATGWLYSGYGGC